MKKRPNKFSGEKSNTPQKKDGNKKLSLSARTRKAGESTPKKYEPKKFNPKVKGKETPTFKSSKIPDKVSKPDDGLIRLNRYIANAGVCSRRDADVLIEQGDIKVNGKLITELGYKVHPSDEVKYKGKKLSREKFVYVLLNKPKDFITTTDDPENRKTVMQLVSKACRERIYPVGRLDRSTTGLLLFTNDGDLAKKLSHPSHNVKKVYQVSLDKPLKKDDAIAINEGIELEDGKVIIDELAIITPDKKTIGLEIHLGKNRIVRRIFEHLGYQVDKLDRVIYAGLTKKDLKRGDWRHLTEKEVIKLKYLK